MSQKSGKRSQFLAAGRRLFSTQGFETTTIDDIVDTVKVGKGTFYAYFKNKSDLLFQLLEEAFKELGEATAKEYRPRKTPQENLLVAFRTYLTYFRENRDLVNILEAVKIPLFDEINRLFLNCFAPQIQRWQEEIDREISRGRFRRIDPKTLLASMMVVNHMLLLREIRFGVPLKTQDLQELEDLLLYGLLNPSLPASPAARSAKPSRKIKS